MQVKNSNFPRLGGGKTKKDMLNWQEIDKINSDDANRYVGTRNVNEVPNGIIKTMRAKVFGGWLVMAVSQVFNNSAYIEHRSSICFVPDANNEWK